MSKNMTMEIFKTACKTNNKLIFKTVWIQKFL